MNWIGKIKRTVKSKAKSIAGKFSAKRTADFEEFPKGSIFIPDPPEQVLYISPVPIIEKKRDHKSLQQLAVSKQRSQKRNWSKWKKRL